jgi:hypothetical protein
MRQMLKARHEEAANKKRRAKEEREALEDIARIAETIYELRDSDQQYDRGQHWPDLYYALIALKQARKDPS